MALKHVGRIKTTKRKVAVAYRTIPGDPYSALVVTTENLMAEEHDALMKLIESDAGQSANELALAMARTTLPDGRNMLAGFHTTGKIVKVDTSNVEMTPDKVTVLQLDELNKIIAEQKGVTLEDLAVQDTGAKVQQAASVNEVPEVVEPLQAATNDVLTDEQLAAQYRSQADAMYKEAKRLREAAEELVPTKKRAKAKTEESA